MENEELLEIINAQKRVNAMLAGNILMMYCIERGSHLTSEQKYKCMVKYMKKLTF